MTHKPPVHVESRENGWAVVREGHKRASSVHPTQSEAAKEGRDIARLDATEFFLHAQDGRVREHRDYGEGSHPASKGVVGQAAETVGAVTGEVGAAIQNLGATGESASPGEDEAGSATGVDSYKGNSDEETSDTEEVHGLTDARHDDFGTLEERYADYEVYDQDGERIGKVDYLFVDENDNPEYVGVRKDPLGTTTALIPADIITVDDSLRHMVVSHPKSVVEVGPSLQQGEDLTHDLEERVHSHYGLTSPRSTDDRGAYGAYYSGAEPDIPVDEEELRIRRSEEELRVETHEREAGAVRVRKRVRTDRERIVVPKKRTEVTVERVPVEEGAVSAEGEAARSEIGEDEIVVPVVEEEIVVEKRPVVKEEIHIRKEVVEETEVVEEDVRREEVEVDDETEQHNPEGGSDPARGS